MAPMTKHGNFTDSRKSRKTYLYRKWAETFIKFSVDVRSNVKSSIIVQFTREKFREINYYCSVNQ